MAGRSIVGSHCHSGRILALILAVSILLNARLVSIYHFHQEEVQVHSRTNPTISSSSALVSSLQQSTNHHRHRRDGSTTAPTATKAHVALIPPLPDAQLIENLHLAWKDEQTGKDISQIQNDPHWQRIHNGTCPPTVQFQLHYYDDDTMMNTTTFNSSTWILYSLDANGNRKSIGGDEMYVVYHHRNHTRIAPTAVAYSIDRGDGSYLLHFYATPYSKPIIEQDRNSGGGGGGQLVINMQYTCGLGTLHHPEKKLWNTGGCLMRTYQHYLPFPPTNIKEYFPPNQNGEIIDLEEYQKVVMFGDSNIHGHFMSSKSTIPNLHFIRKPDSPLGWRAMQNKFLPKIAWFLNLTMIEDNNKKKKKNKYALMIGSACWDIVFPERSGPHFRDHLKAVKYMLTELKRTTFQDNVDIFWHSGFAIHVHVAGEEEWEHRQPLKYMSYSRSVELYQKQKEVLEEVGGGGGDGKTTIRLLDFMHATYLSGDHYMKGDARHAQAGLSRKLLYYYYPKQTEPKLQILFGLSGAEPAANPQNKSQP